MSERRSRSQARAADPERRMGACDHGWMPVAFLRRRCLLAAVLLPFFVPSAHAQSSARLPPAVEAALARGMCRARRWSPWVQEVGRPGPRLAWQARQAGQPGVADEARDDLRRARAARPGLHLDDAGLAAGHRRRRRARRQRSSSRAAAIRSSCSSGMWLLLQRVQQARRARDPRRHRPRPQRLRAADERTRPTSTASRCGPTTPAPTRCCSTTAPCCCTFTPDPRRGVATIAVDPPLAGVRVDAGVPLVNGALRRLARRLKARVRRPGAAALRRRLPGRLRREGLADRLRRPASYNERALAGAVAEHRRPAQRRRPRRAVAAGDAADLRAALAAARRSRPRHQQAQQQRDGAAALPDPRLRPSAAPARRKRRARCCARGCPAASARGGRRAVVIANGSGLSRDRASARRCSARLLQAAWASPVMPELMSSLPVAGIDGTLRRSKGRPAAPT